MSLAGVQHGSNGTTIEKTFLGPAAPLWMNAHAQQRAPLRARSLTVVVC